MKKILPGALIAVVIGLCAFFGGMKYGESTNLQANSMRGNFGNMQDGIQKMGATNGANIRLGMMGGNKGTTGEIIGIDEKSITVKIPSGGSKIVFFSDSTKITKSTTATTADLTSGTTVMASGTTNSDGSITATTIQISPPIQTGTQQQEPPQMTPPQSEPTSTTQAN